MDATFLGVLGAIATLVTFLYGVYRVVKKDYEAHRAKVVTQVDECVKDNAASKEALKRLHLRIDNVEHSQEKLETTVEKMADKLETKLDKIMDFLLESRN